MKIFNILIIVLYSPLGYSNAYEFCDWTNLTLTSKIIEQTQFTDTVCGESDSPEACTPHIQEESPEEDSSSILSLWKQLNTFLEDIWFSFFHDTEEDVHIVDMYKIDDVCFLASSIKGKNIFKIKGSQYPCTDNRTNLNQRFYYCNDLDTSDSCQTVMPVTDNEGNTRLIYPRAPCLSESYIQTLSASFNNMSYCFNLSKTEQNDLFALIHHESSFMPNIRSPAGATCSGQLTTKALIHLNMDILLTKNPVYSNYANAIERCPYLTDILIPNDLLTNGHYQNKSYADLQNELENLNFTCTLISDMSRCFFYSFLFHRTSIKLTEQELSPLKTFLSLEDLDSFKSFVSYLAYNGGHSIIRTQLGKFINTLTHCPDNVECAVENLNIESIKSDFINHLREAKNKNNNYIYAKETLHYPYKIQKDLKYFHSNLLIQHLLNFRTTPPFTVEEIETFSDEVKHKCQFYN